MADLAPLWLSLRVAAAATALDRRAGAADGAGCWPGGGSRARGCSRASWSCRWSCRRRSWVYVLLLLLGRRAWLGGWLEQTLGVVLVFHWSGAVLASAVAAFPLFLLPARGAFEGVDPALEDVARLLGRRELSVFLAVTLPLAWRGLAAGAVLAFARALGDFGATMMVAGEHPRAHPDGLAGDLRRRPGRTTRPARGLADALDLARSSIAALWLVQRTLPRAGAGPVSDAARRARGPRRPTDPRAA